ncbi:MAG: porphobilinogen synthase [Pseudomonadota bacterium]
MSHFSGSYPRTRLRRNRQSPWIRSLVAENAVTPADLILCAVVIPGKDAAEPIKSMPGIHRLTPDRVVAAAREAASHGIPLLSMFPALPQDGKDAEGSEALNPDNLICQTARMIKDAGIPIGVMADVALDPYTSHAHDGLMGEDGRILNDATVDALCQQALLQAQAGVDVMGPSDMMDGRIGALRDALDADGFTDTLIMSYAAKYASAFYGPYRDAIKVEGLLKGDKKTYQMDPANSHEAVREAWLDVAEGADMLMVKPGLPYLDIIRRLKDECAMPTYAFNVSGEYAMLKWAAEAGALNYDRALLEMMMSFKRAGADGVLTYAALDVCRILQG